jgi:glycosyltransferase involved in cell wall biosynthesis
MTADPRVVFGMPAYGRADTLARVFESLFSQTDQRFAIVIVDDRPLPEVRAIVETYAAISPRITYEPNPVRLGMIGNWRKAFDRSREIYPGSEYFAWVSDHDIWHPRWLEVLVGVLDEHPELVLAYPQMQRVFPKRRRAITRRFDTAGVTSPIDRLRLAVSGMTAGNCIYGLFRARTLAQAGVFRPVLAPDRQLLVQLSLLGEFKHVPEILWYREVAGMFSYTRQRKMFFPTRTPLHTYLPANVQHFGILLWDLCVRGRGRPAFGRITGARYALAQLWYSTMRELRRDGVARWRVALRHTALGRWLPGERSTTDAPSDMVENGITESK